MNKKILNLAIPNIISNLTVPLTGIVDMALAGRLGSSAHIAGTGFGTMIFTFIYAGLGFLRMGTTGLSSQAFGASSFKESANILSRALILAISLGAILIMLQTQIEYLFISLISDSEESLTYAAQYFRLRIWAAPATLSVFVFMGWFIGLQNSKIPMYITILISFINITSSIFFVLALDMSIRGIALGTVIAQYCGLIACLLFYTHRYDRYSKLFSIKLTFDAKASKKFFSVNRDIFIRSLLLTSSLYYFNVISVSFGTDTLALNTIMLQFLWLFSYVADGFSYAGSALSGRYTGAKDYILLKKVVRRCVLFGFYISIIFTIAYSFAGKQIFRIFTDNHNVLKLANDYIHWIAIIPLASFMAFVYDGIYTGATATKTMRNVMLTVIIVLFLPSLHIFKYLWGNQGIWLSMILMLFARGAGLWIMSQKAIYFKGA